MFEIRDTISLPYILKQISFKNIICIFLTTFQQYFIFEIYIYIVFTEYFLYLKYISTVSLPSPEYATSSRFSFA